VVAASLKRIALICNLAKLFFVNFGLTTYMVVVYKGFIIRVTQRDLAVVSIVVVVLESLLLEVLESLCWQCWSRCCVGTVVLESLVV